MRNSSPARGAALCGARVCVFIMGYLCLLTLRYRPERKSGMKEKAAKFRFFNNNRAILRPLRYIPPKWQKRRNGS